jgi:mono/diheme cytochrome c family protein
MLGSRTKTTAALLAPTLLIAGASGPLSAQDDETATFDGEWRYQVSCASCHGVNGEGVSAFGPPMRGNALVMNAPPEPIIMVIQEGRHNRNKSYPEYSGMPAFYYIRAAEARALVEYMKTALQE